jgi:hypothetical protein
MGDPSRKHPAARPNLEHAAVQSGGGSNAGAADVSRDAGSHAGGQVSDWNRRGCGGAHASASAWAGPSAPLDTMIQDLCSSAIYLVVAKALVS